MGFIPLLLFLNACTSFPVVDTHNYLTPVIDETLQAYRLNQPVNNRLEAVMAAHYALQTTRIEPEETPYVIYSDKMACWEAPKLIIPCNLSLISASYY